MPKVNCPPERFAEEYLALGDQTKAYRKALGGEPRKNDRNSASKTFAREDVQTALRILRAQLSEKAQITAEAVIQELAKIGFANMADYIQVNDANVFVDLSKMTRDQAAAVSEITVEEYMEGRGEAAREVRRTKFKLSDKRAALCDLGKHLGLFREDSGKEDLPPPTRVVIEVVDGRKSDGD